MSGLVLLLILVSAALHPLREFYIKGDATPEGVTLAVNICFGVLAGIHVFVEGMDPWTALQVWPMRKPFGRLSQRYICSPCLSS